jgi:hypothetical protein
MAGTQLRLPSAAGAESELIRRHELMQRILRGARTGHDSVECDQERRRLPEIPASGH